MENSQRVDLALVTRGLAPSRERAQGLIAAGLVTVNGKTIGKSAVKISDEDVIAVLGNDLPYVSRGGLKLEKALRSFEVDPAGKVCMDIGASTGGFTDVLLQNDAAKVYAIDVGTGQLSPKLANDPRVVSLEHTNARALDASLFDLHPTLAVMDVSFISIRLILPAAFRVLGAEGRMISLIKPQFEAGPQNIGKNGIVSNPKVQAAVLKQLVSFTETLGWRIRKLDFSPIQGGSGNLEFLGDFQPIESRKGTPINDRMIDDLVRAAHRALK